MDSLNSIILVIFCFFCASKRARLASWSSLSSGPWARVSYWCPGVGGNCMDVVGGVTGALCPRSWRMSTWPSIVARKEDSTSSLKTESTTTSPGLLGMEGSGEEGCKPIEGSTKPHQHLFFVTMLQLSFTWRPVLLAHWKHLTLFRSLFQHLLFHIFSIFVMKRRRKNCGLRWMILPPNPALNLHVGELKWRSNPRWHFQSVAMRCIASHWSCKQDCWTSENNICVLGLGLSQNSDSLPTWISLQNSMRICKCWLCKLSHSTLANLCIDKFIGCGSMNNRTPVEQPACMPQCPAPQTMIGVQLDRQLGLHAIHQCSCQTTRTVHSIFTSYFQSCYVSSIPLLF